MKIQISAQPKKKKKKKRKEKKKKSQKCSKQHNVYVDT